MSRPSMPLHRHDPYWDMDGAGARRVRAQRRVVRYGMWLATLLVLMIALTRLPSIDTEFLVQGGGRPLFAGALLTILGSAALLALARVRHTPED